ncbi:predicted protein, partial [Nematostella vectensis]
MGRSPHDLFYQSLNSIITLCSCPVDKTVRFHKSPRKTKERFSLEAFKFLGDHPFVFIHCHVIVCNANDPNSRCAKGCVRSSK